MTYFTDLHTYLHQSSLLIQAYPSARITTKYALPRKPNTKAKSKPKESRGKDDPVSGASTTDTAATTSPPSQPQSKRERSAVLTLKTYHAESGLCLKYRTDKAAEVGRLLNGLGRLAKGEVIEMPAAAAVSAAPGAGTGVDGDKMDVDGGSVAATTKIEDKVVTAPPAVTQGGGGGKGKKKKGKK
ncbi:uncharacterized protein Z520_00462 [Fonsecaea multimorphosa CBS 102226]|uniref:SRP9 domain-containing protein n=1 Tax=Fonsecaea multimorphosa CBS 102226 TaxID=1442371 RepID=A0A0D2HPL1_9EURO|nr:uncharacterized protein Z520_00462 [Fonsecaea multimorphosa CBS 102226]KIY03771.1 hypothetical protein Z520_00462 [Fonsecaea multimorphosa CBS 102226]OAL32464.1 hypothetical protein AYO22_00486 [Fonsecaea multimorphosa]